MGAATIRTILVAIADPGERAQPGMVRAARLARPLGAKIVLFHAAFDSTLSGRPFFDSRRLAKVRAAWVAERRARLERAATALQRAGIAASVMVAWAEPTYEAVIRAAIRAKADLVVAGHHVPGRARGSLTLRHTDWQLMRLLPGPLLLARVASGARASGDVLVAVDPTHAKDKAAALDHSLLRWGSAIATALETRLHVVHCVPSARDLLGYEVGNPARLRSRLRRQVVAEIRRVGVRVHRVHIVTGAPEAAIPSAARKIGAQLLVMGAISRRGLRRLVIGDTAERVIHRVDCDLLIVKPDSFRSRPRRLRTEPVAP